MTATERQLSSDRRAQEPHLLLAAGGQGVAAQGRGVIDSIGVSELVEFLQKEFGCSIVEDEIMEANLGSLGAIARFVYAKRNGTGGIVRPHQVA